MINKSVVRATILICGVALLGIAAFISSSRYKTQADQYSQLRKDSISNAQYINDKLIQEQKEQEQKNCIAEIDERLTEALRNSEIKSISNADLKLVLDLYESKKRDC